MSLKKILLWGLSGLVVLLVGAALWLYLAVYPRHYRADEFENLAAIAAAAENLRLAELRGQVRQDYLPSAIWNLSPETVQVYPSGVIIKLRGVFTYESGLYVPSKRVADKLKKLDSPVYEYLGSGVYSYKREG